MYCFYALDHTACKKVCITVSNRRLEGFGKAIGCWHFAFFSILHADSVLSPIYVDIPRCAVIYNDAVSLACNSYLMPATVT